MQWTDIPADSLAVLRKGSVIPAHLLALDAHRKLDVRRQRAMTRYYLDAGSGGVAVGVHSTQFAIRDVGLYEPVLELAMQTAREWEPIGGRRPLFMVAGLAGRTEQAVREAGIVELLIANVVECLGPPVGAHPIELHHNIALVRPIPKIGEI